MTAHLILVKSVVPESRISGKSHPQCQHSARAACPECSVDGSHMRDEDEQSLRRALLALNMDSKLPRDTKYYDCQVGYTLGWVDMAVIE